MYELQISKNFLTGKKWKNWKAAESVRWNILVDSLEKKTVRHSLEVAKGIIGQYWSIHTVSVFYEKEIIK